MDKFCKDMESTPVGVIVGLFSAISQKLPALREWDSEKHHTALNSNWAVCDALTDVRQHVNRYGMETSPQAVDIQETDSQVRQLPSGTVSGHVRPRRL